MTLLTNPPECLMEVDHGAQLVTTTWRGIFDMAAVRQSCVQRTNRGGHVYPQFIQADGAEIAHGPADGRALPGVVMQMANDVRNFGPMGPTAIVVHASIDFGVCRRIAAYFNDVCEIRAFYHADEAMRWLDRSPTSI